MSVLPQERVREVMAGAVGAKVPYPIGIRELEVLRTRALGTALVRVTLGGSGATGFQSHVAEEHVRLIFPDERGELRLPEPNGSMLRWPRPLPVSREYTVRRHDPACREIDIDVALHPGGVGADWAASVVLGDRIHVAGPPGGFALPHGYHRYLFGGDITALPQIARYLETLPRDAAGWAFVEVTDEAEQVELPAPERIEVRWVHRGNVPPGPGGTLETAMRAVRPPSQARTFVWIAGEAVALKPLRRWARDELGNPRADTRIVGYWKRGIEDFDDED